MRCRFIVRALAAFALVAVSARAQQFTVPERWNRQRQPEVTARTFATLLESDRDASKIKVWISFTDKGLASEQERSAALAAAANDLDAHSAARRARVFGQVLVDEFDLPLCESYLETLESQGVELLHQSRWLAAVSARAPLEVLARVAKLPFVRSIRLVASARRRANPTLPPPPPPPAPPWGGLEGSRTHLDYGPSLGQFEEIHIVSAHRRGLSGAGVRIAFLDTGYWRDHPCFQRMLAEGRLLDQWDFIGRDGETQDEAGDPAGQHNHGTSTLSLVAGYEEGELIGAAYGAQFLLAKTEDVSSETPVEEDYWVAAAEWAERRGADVLSSSLSYTEWYDYSDMDGETAVTTLAADIAVSRGVVVCVAAGNWGTQDWYYIGAPADCKSGIAVGASQPDGSMWDDSSHGPTFDGRIKPEVVARGALTYTAVVPGGHGGSDLYRELDGTSVACPLVAGAAALILEANPTWTPAEVRAALIETADTFDTPDDHRGYGRIDVTAAIDQ